MEGEGGWQVMVWKRIKYGRLAHAFNLFNNVPLCRRAFGRGAWSFAGDEMTQCVECERKAKERAAKKGGDS